MAQAREENTSYCQITLLTTTSSRKICMESLGYVKDTIGDVESAKYGRARSSVPRFRRSGGKAKAALSGNSLLIFVYNHAAGRVVGLDGGLRIAFDGPSNEIEILPGGRKVCCHYNTVCAASLDSPLRGCCRK